ncbi:hypothetical protein C0V75_18820 [Tabrizicola sp. TH137]|uniref:HdeA/HdeB family chaperone n=1 Tax=Tabrizicola sp. TH137 TaxID=2067452 RepID=UPI000C7C6827|nr:HdeA/HdeB family chaperone [Tabrizicola sp. TH137]PLL10744.1 hypothetical protein C0V75_18820 [Tabrizicola sp. TH137]
MTHLSRMASATLLAAMLASPALAQSADISTITCADLATMDQDGITTLLFWIDGYMGGQAQDPTFDLDRLSANIDGAIALCQQNPGSSVMDALYTAENG